MAGELDGKTILLVDDDRDILASMEAALSELGPTLVTARDGNEAVEQANAHQPDLIVLDMMMPKRSGFLVMENLRRSRKPEDVPKVIMVTGNEGNRHRVYAESLGVSAYMNKPFRMEKLIETITDLLS